MTSINNPLVTRGGFNRIISNIEDNRAIYVCAPAGYGKTVAITQWLNKDKRTKAILSADEYDNNLTGFCMRFCTALLTCQPGNKLLAEYVSHSLFASAPDEFALRAITALSRRKKSVLVIDDLHLIHDEAVLKILLIFLKRLPEKIQIVLISRFDLPVGFSDLWLKGQVTRITAEHLRFNEDEVVSLYKKRGSPITKERAAQIIGLTNGWVIGINALLLSGGEISGEIKDYLSEFIRSNIWDNWNDETREFMMRTALLRELDPQLCAELTGVQNSEGMLKKLKQSGTFITQTQDGVYRYHHLFQEFLRRMLEERGKPFSRQILDAEGYWRLKQQDFYGAADSFIRSKNHDGIAKCFDLLEISDRNDFVTDRLMPILKHPEVINAAGTYPHLFLLMVYGSLSDGRVEDMDYFCDRYYAGYTEIAARTPHLAHNIFYVRFMDVRIPLSQIISELGSITQVPDVKGVQGSTSMHMPMLHRGVVDFSEIAMGSLEDNFNTFQKVGWIFGEEKNMVLNTLKAGLLFEQGYIEAANKHALCAVAELKSKFSAEYKFCSMSILVCTLDALEDYDEAERITNLISQTIEAEKAYHLNHNFNALTVRRKLATCNTGIACNTKVADSWIKARISIHSDTPSVKGFFITYTTCIAYIAEGKYDSAIIILKKNLEIASASKRVLDIIEAQILLAIAFWKKKRSFKDEAMCYLENATNTAYPYRYTQMFVTHAHELAGMLQKLQNRAKQKPRENAAPLSFIKMLTLQVRLAESKIVKNEVFTPSVKYTQKQKAIIKLLCEGKSYKEMAEAMGIKLPTLRSHISLIYNKLDVTNQVDAVVKIRATGLNE